MRKYKRSKYSGNGKFGGVCHLNAASSCYKKHIASCPCGYHDILPWWLPWCIVTVTMVIRIYYVILPANWWILHPDEIYQSTEVAFSEVYGYGFRPYEYLPPPSTNTSIPAEKQVLQSGMYSLRSFLYPSLFTAVLSLARFFGYDQNPFLICRVFNVMLTSTLPLSVSKFVYTLCKCRLLSVLACALTASCFRLAVFGTHILINSFIGSPVFLALSLCLPQNSDDSLHAKKNPDNVSFQIGPTVELDRLSVRTKAQCPTLKNVYKETPKISNQNGKHFTYDDLQSSSEETARDKPEPANEDKSHISNQNTSTYHFFYFTGADQHMFIGGFLAGIVCYIRFDTALFCSVVFLPLFVVSTLTSRRKLLLLFNACVGCSFAVLLGIVQDVYTYGNGTLSPIQWFYFNVFSEKANILFGMEPVFIYISIILPDKLSILINMCVIGVLLYSLHTKDIVLFRSQGCAIFTSFVTLILIYSCIGHKESRFLHNLFALHAIVLSFASHSLVLLLKKSDNLTQHVGPFLAVLVAIFTFNSYTQFPSIQNNSTSSWTYKSAETSREVNVCLDFIRQQDGVTGVMVNASIYSVGGFTVLKHDVPLLIKIHKEFHLYESSKDNRIGKDSKIRIINDFSDYVHQSNHQYVRKLLTQDNIFNYIVTYSYLERYLQQMIYTKLAIFGKYAVFHRNVTLVKEKKLNKAAKLIPYGDNATVLEYESNWLITNGLYQRAIERVKRGLELGRPRVRLYQQMIVCYGKLKVWDKVNFYQEQCFRDYGREACNKQQPKLVIDQEYKHFDTN